MKVINIDLLLSDEQAETLKRIAAEWGDQVDDVASGMLANRLEQYDAPETQRQVSKCIKTSTD